MYDAGGRAWFRVMGDDGRWRLYKDDFTPTGIEEKYIDVSDAGGRAWFRVEGDDGRYRLYKDDSTPTTIEGKYIDVSDAGGRAWFSVKGDDGRWRFYKDDSTPTGIEGKYIYVYDAGGRAWFSVKGDDGRWRLYKDNFTPTTIEGEDIYVYDAGGRAWFRVMGDDGRYHLYKDDFTPFLSENVRVVETDRGLIMLDSDSLFPLADLERAAKSDAIRARVAEALKCRLALPSVLYPLTRLPDDIWRTFVADPRRHELLTLIKTADALEYASRHTSDPLPDKLRDALIVIDKVPHPGVARDIYLDRIMNLTRSGLDMVKLVHDLASGRESEDVVAVRHYLQTKEAVGPGRSAIEPPTGKAIDLADVVTHIRLQGKGIGIDNARKAKRYNCAEDRRQLDHAIHHLHATHPHIYIRELLQNALDVQMAPGRVADGDHRIDVDTFMDGNELVFRVHDRGGMTEEEVMDLLVPGEGVKRNGGYRGGFGIGFYAAMAGAKWVRLKTAVKGATEVIVLEFDIRRGAGGRIEGIEVKTEKVPSTDGFFGTIVESARLSRMPMIEASQIKTRVKDTAQYIARHEADVHVDGVLVNEGRNGPLVEVTDAPWLGRVALYDGLSNRLLLGGLPLTDLPTEVWDSIPDGLKDYYRRRGFYVDMDHTRLKPTPTRDRLENQSEAMESLEAILPGMLVQGFLGRVTRVGSASDLKHLPEVYFIKAYKLASEEKLGSQIIQDAERINTGRYGEVDWGQYSRDEEGEQNLIRLMTMVKFIKVEGRDEPLSLREIHGIYQRAAHGSDTDKALMEKIRTSPALPQGIQSALVYAGRVEETAERDRVRVASGSDIVDDLAPERTYALSEIRSEVHRRYLALLEEVTKSVWREFGGTDVAVGINTRADHAAAFAYHDKKEGRYHLYRSFGQALDADAQELASIVSEPNRPLALHKFEPFLAKMYEDVTHELTHVITETPHTFTHSGGFYRDQMDIMLQVPLAKDQAKKWYEGLR